MKLERKLVPNTQRCALVRPATVLTVSLLNSVLACSPITEPEGARKEFGLVSAGPSIEGVWTLVEREIQGGPNPRVESGSQIQPSLIIYTERYVMWAVVTGTEPRPADATNSDAARHYVSAGAAYDLDGSTLRYHRFVSLHPRAMLRGNQPLVRELVALTATSLETSGTNADGVTLILRYTRLRQGGNDSDNGLSPDHPIEGVWTLVAKEIRGGPNPRVEFGSQIQPSLLVYSEGYVMWAFVTGSEPRRADATIGDAARHYASAGADYELDGSTLRYHRFVSLHPRAMLPENQPLVRELVALTATSLETSGTNADGVTLILRYTRLE